MKRTRIYNTATGKWERWTVEETPLRPWRHIRLEVLLALRGLGKVLRGAMPRQPQELELDPVTLRMRDARERRRERFRKAAHAVLSMVKMQKFIK